MSYSELVDAFLREVEGVRKNPYKDSAGKWTVGVGHLILPTDHFTFPLDDASINGLLDRDRDWAERGVDRAIKVNLNDSQRAALVSFHFNTGSLGLEHPIRLEKKLNAGDYDSVPTELRHWIWKHVNGQAVKDQGLINRREKEISLWLGNWSS